MEEVFGTDGKQASGEEANRRAGSEALECVQLAAAFSRGSLLPRSRAITEIVPTSPSPSNAAFPASELAGGKAAASCTHSKLRSENGRLHFGTSDRNQIGIIDHIHRNTLRATGDSIHKLKTNGFTYSS